MACGLPVVGVAAGGVAESVDQAVGELAERSEPAAFAGAVEALFDRDLPALRLAARARVLERHGWDSVFTRLAGIYTDVSGDEAFNQPAAQFALAG